MKKNIITFILLFYISSCSWGYDRDEITNINVYEQINPAIVSIDTQIKYGLSCGTGCVVSNDGIILTSSHVIEDGNDITVTIFNGKTYKAEVLKKMGRNNDLALLKIKVDHPMQTVKLGNSELIKVGQKVLAIGNPFGFNGTLTQGIISRIDYSKNKFHKARKQKIKFKEQFVSYSYTGETFVTDDGDELVTGAQDKDKIIITYTLTKNPNPT